MHTLVSALASPILASAWVIPVERILRISLNLVWPHVKDDQHVNKCHRKGHVKHESYADIREHFHREVCKTNLVFERELDVGAAEDDLKLYHWRNYASKDARVPLWYVYDEDT